MQIVKYIDLFVGAAINMLLCTYIIKVVFKASYIKNKKVLILSFLISAFALTIINVFNKDIFKILLTFPFVVIGVKIIFSINYNKSILYVIFATLYMFIGELLIGIVLALLPFDYTFIFNNVLGTIIGNILVAILTLPLLTLRKINKLVNKIVNNINEKNNIIIELFIIIAIGAVTYRNLFNAKSEINMIINVAIALTFLVILFMYYKENIKLNELSDNYNIMFNYLEKYEKELTEKRKIIHDYKNQLIVINGYIGNDKKLKEYLKEIIDEQKSISENSIIRNIDKLPRGLKGLVYYKFSHIDKEIKVNLNVINSIKKFDKLPAKLNKDVLKIVGVLIDNAIEAVEYEEEKIINLDFSIVKDKFIMNMSNTCTKHINMENIMAAGFSTKNKNRGYGLTLVKDILNHEKKIKLNFDISEEEFISKMQVKL